MKILHVTFGIAPYATGGLPAYVKDLAIEEKKMKNEVFILKPGPYGIKGNTKIIKRNNIYEILNPLPIPSIFGIGEPLSHMINCDINIYRIFLLELNPDIIHVHSIMGIHKEFFEVAKDLKIKMIYTTHDYFGLCIRTNYIDRKADICTGRNCKECAKCNYKAGLSKKKVFIMQSRIYNNIKKWNIIKKLRSRLRKRTTKQTQKNVLEEVIIDEQTNSSYEKLLHYYKNIILLMDYFHFNSEISKEIFEAELGKLEGEVIPITLSSIQDHRKEIVKTANTNGEKLVIGYIGRKEPYKGINLLANALKHIDTDNLKYECKLYGDDFTNYEKESPSIQNKGTYKREELESIMKNIDILIVPSVWQETFGFVTLEALSYKVPVIVTDCVGSKILLKGCKLNPIVEPNEVSLSKKIIEFGKNKKLLQEYKEWIENIDDIFSMDKHTKLILKMYKERIK